MLQRLLANLLLIVCSRPRTNPKNLVSDSQGDDNNLEDSIEDSNADRGDDNSIKDIDGDRGDGYDSEDSIEDSNADFINKTCMSSTRTATLPSQGDIG